MAEIEHLTRRSSEIRIDEATNTEYSVSFTPSIALHSSGDFLLSFLFQYTGDTTSYNNNNSTGILSKTWGLPVPALQQSLLLDDVDTWLSLAGVDLVDARNYIAQTIFGPDALASQFDISAVTVHIETRSSSSRYADNDEEEEGEELLRAVEKLSISEYDPTRKAVRVEVVEALEKVVVRDAERETSCVVCLAEFSLGDEMKKMPCSHVFHGDCIDKWLKYQCVCPLCRFELPS